MQQEHSAGIIVYRIEGNLPNFLLLHYTSGHWDFPKGHLEPGESPEQAARRELTEETGIFEITLHPSWKQTISYFYTSHDKRISKRVDFFLGETTSTNIKLSHEHQGFIWLTLEKALEKLTFENAKQLLRAATHEWTSTLPNHDRRPN